MRKSRFDESLNSLIREMGRILNAEVLNVVTTHEVTAVELRVTVAGETVVTTGHAKKDPMDKPDEKIGLLLAYSRALEAASRRLDKRANGYVNHAEHLRKQKQGKGNSITLSSANRVNVRTANNETVTFTRI